MVYNILTDLSKIVELYNIVKRIFFKVEYIHSWQLQSKKFFSTYWIGWKHYDLFDYDFYEWTHSNEFCHFYFIILLSSTYISAFLNYFFF